MDPLKKKKTNLISLIMSKLIKNKKIQVPEGEESEYEKALKAYNMKQYEYKQAVEEINNTKDCKKVSDSEYIKVLESEYEEALKAYKLKNNEYKEVVQARNETQKAYKIQNHNYMKVKEAQNMMKTTHVKLQQAMKNEYKKVPEACDMESQEFLQLQEYNLGLVRDVLDNQQKKVQQVYNELVKASNITSNAYEVMIYAKIALWMKEFKQRFKSLF